MSNLDIDFFLIANTFFYSVFFYQVMGKLNRNKALVIYDILKCILQYEVKITKNI